MSEDRLTPERAVRLLRAKAGELESYALSRNTVASFDLAADIALVADILASFMEDADARRRLYEAHVENLIERVHDLEQSFHYHTNTGKVLTNEDIQALADEAEQGYDVKPLICRAARWNATPVFDGPHESHFFTYGEHGEYTGSCAGWPKP